MLRVQIPSSSKLLFKLKNVGRMGFEPMVFFRYFDIANRYFKPLSHLPTFILKKKYTSYKPIINKKPTNPIIINKI